MSIDQLVEEIRQLPHDLQVQLVDRLVEDVGAHVDPEVEKAHLEMIAERQRTATTFVPGEEVLQRIRSLLPK